NEAGDGGTPSRGWPVAVGSRFGSNSSVTPQSRRAPRLRTKAGWAASAAFGHGTTIIGRPSPTASLSRPRASVSLMPWAHLLTVLNVAGAAARGSGGGSRSGSSGRLYRVRTGWPVRPARFPASRNLSPSGVAITHTFQP